MEPCQGQGCEAAPPHRDLDDIGRTQVVIALSPGAFDVWPGSHKLSLKGSGCVKGHFHTTSALDRYLQNSCPHVVFACSPGDVLLFKGGLTFHGSPAIGRANPSPRVMTYATFWPPSTKKGGLHCAGKCGTSVCAALRDPFAEQPIAPPI